MRPGEMAQNSASAIFGLVDLIIATSVPDARIEHDIEHVHHKVHEHVDARENEQHALYNRVVAMKDRVHDEPAHARNCENALGHHYATEKKRDSYTNNGHNRCRGVRKRVIEEEPLGWQTFRPRGSDMVLLTRPRARSRE